MSVLDQSTFSNLSPAREILVVDDTLANLQVIQGILATDGYRVRLARNAQRAIATLEKQAPDLILLDVMMPGMDGFELCTQLKANPATAGIPIIFITALTEPEHKVRAFEIGGVDYIAKPFHRLEVLARVRHHLNYQRAQAALQASERQLRAIFTAMTDLVVIRDRQGRCLQVAPTQATHELASEQELLHSRLADIVEPSDVAALQDAIATTLDQQQTQQIQYQRLATNGKTWLDARLSPLTPETVVWVARDISETKANEQKLQRNEQELRRVFEAMTDLVLSITLAHQDIRVMPTRYAQTVAAAPEVIAATFKHIFDTTMPASAQDAIATVLQTQQPQTWEYQLLTDRGNLWFSANISLLSAETVLWVARDISDRVQAQQAVEHLATELEQRVVKRTAELQMANADLQREINERRRAQALWERSELRFQVAVDNLPDLFVIYDPQLRYQFVNQQVLRLMELPEAAILGKSDLELLSAQMHQTYLPLLEQTVQTGEIQRRECSIRTPKQGRMTFLVTYVPLFDETGQLTQILGIAHDITEQKRSEQALNQAKEQLQTVIDAVPGFVSWLGILDAPDNPPEPEFYYLGVNRKLAQLHQLPPEDFVGQPLGFLNPNTTFRAFLQSLFAQADRKTYSEVITTPVQGEPQSYLVVGQKYNNNTSAVTVGIDISDRVRMEQRLQQAYERSQLLSELTLKVRQSLEIEEIVSTVVQELQDLLEADRVALMQADVAGTNLLVQEAHCSGGEPLDRRQMIAFVTAADFETHKFLAIDDTQTVSSRSPEAAAFYAQHQIRAQIVVPIYVQQTFWGGLMVHYCGAPHAWSADEIELLLSLADQIGIALAQAQLLDNLEDRVAERTQELQQEVLERRRAQQALSSSQDQLQRIIQNSAYGIVICNLYGEIQFANPAALALFGRNAQELMGFNLGIPVGQEQNELSILSAQGGTSRTVEMRSGEIYWQEQPGYLISLMDITERKQVEQMKDEFLSIASHELRTPLTSIRGALGLLATGKLGSFSPQGQSMIEIAVNNSQRLARLLDDILDLERIAAGQLTLAKTDVNAVDLMLQAAQALESAAVDRQVSLQLRAGQQGVAQIPPPQTDELCPLPAPLWFWADGDQVVRILINLISNAIKFSEPGQTVVVEVDAMARSTVQFAVRDRGRGIPTSNLESIFGRFQQVDASDSREKGGTGLGLAICKEIVEHHDGKIWVESTLGQGSAFYVWLPS
ncbi:MAG: PAS domain S-box protein [Spirulinaceae cyanobacterium]